MPVSAPAFASAVVTFNGSDPIVTIETAAVAGASGYRISRDAIANDNKGGVTVAVRSATTTIADSLANNPSNPPLADTTYRYRVYAEDGSGVDGYRLQQQLVVTIPASAPPAPNPDTNPPPAPQPGPYLTPPANMRVQSHSRPQPNQFIETYTWDARAGAVQYRVYKDGMQLLGSVNAPARTWTVDTNQVSPLRTPEGTTIVVTAVDSSGNESIPGERQTVAGAFNSWSTGTWPAPYAVTVTPLWNNGAPIMWVEWKSTEGEMYRIYRQGQLVASGINRMEYIDENVTAGATYTYEIDVYRWDGTSILASAKSSGVSGTALTAQPQGLLNTFTATVVKRGQYNADVQVTDLGPQGALDYRAFPASAQPYEGDKYCGRGTATPILQVNGLNNGSGNAISYKVQALDKPGPFQQHEFHNAPGMANTTPILHVNGHGNPCFVPNVLAETTVSLYGTALALTGTQQFNDTDTYNHDFSLTDTTVDQSLIDGHVSIGLTAVLDAGKLPLLLKKQQNSKFNVYFVRANMENSRVFFKGKHPMTVLADGATPGAQQPLHNFNSSLIIQPKTFINLSVTTDILHLFWDLDPHFGDSNRRWFKVVLAGSDATTSGWWVPDEEFTNVPVKDGKYLLFATFGDSNRFKYNNGPGIGQEVIINGIRGGHGEGTERDLDRRVSYDVYVRRSDGRVAIFEDGTRVIDTTITMPSLNWASLKAGFIHQAYHTTLDYQGEQRDRNSKNRYHINWRRFADERHWRNFGFEINPSGGIP